MPIYEYMCEQCQNIFEIKKSMSDISKIEKCPICMSSNLSFHWTTTNLIRKTSSNRDNNSPIKNILKYGKSPFNVLYLENVIAENSEGAGIAVKNGVVRGKNVKLIGNKKGIESKNSIVEINGLKIKNK